MDQVLEKVRVTTRGTPGPTRPSADQGANWP